MRYDPSWKLLLFATLVAIAFVAACLEALFTVGGC